MPTTILLCRPGVLALLSQPLYHSLPGNPGTSGAQFANAISQAFLGGRDEDLLCRLHPWRAG
jgi:hypothetical protein